MSSSNISRRKFLAAAAVIPALPAVAAIPHSVAAGTIPSPVLPAAAEAIATPIIPPTHFYYVKVTEDDKGRPTPYGVHGTRRDAMRHNYSKARVMRVPFRPLATERRFRVAVSKWEPYGIMAATDDFDRVAEAEARERYRQARNSYHDPISLVEVPLEIDAGDDQWFSNDEVYTRDQGLAKVADLNAAEVEETRAGDIDDDKPGRLLVGMDWRVLVEIGRTIAVPDLRFKIESNGMGSMELEYSRPVRVVYPAADELARFPIPAPTTVDVNPRRLRPERDVLVASTVAGVLPAVIDLDDPDVEIYRSSSKIGADAFVDRFNELERENPDGSLAVRVADYAGIVKGGGK